MLYEVITVAAKMEGLRLVIVRQAAETGQLYGSVTARDIRDAAKEAGYTVEKTAAHLHQPIKALGTYAVPFVLHPEVKVEISVIVARSLEEAERVQKAEIEIVEEDVAPIEAEVEAPAEETAE